EPAAHCVRHGLGMVNRGAKVAGSNPAPATSFSGRSAVPEGQSKRPSGYEPGALSCAVCFQAVAPVQGSVPSWRVSPGPAILVREESRKQRVGRRPTFCFEAMNAQVQALYRLLEPVVTDAGYELWGMEHVP